MPSLGILREGLIHILQLVKYSGNWFFLIPFETKELYFLFRFSLVLLIHLKNLSDLEPYPDLLLQSCSASVIIIVIVTIVREGDGTHSSTLAWKIPWTEEPGRLQSMGSLRVGHDWVTSLSLFTFMYWRRKWQPTPVFLPGTSQGRGSLMGCPSMGLHGVRHDWSDLAAAAAAA